MVAASAPSTAPAWGPNADYGNFRYNGGLLSGNASLIKPGDPDAVGMDEDYDACDLENWFLAIQSADGQVIIPSFHRSGDHPLRPRKQRQRLGSHQPVRQLVGLGGPDTPAGRGRRP